MSQALWIFRAPTRYQCGFVETLGIKRDREGRGSNLQHFLPYSGEEPGQFKAPRTTCRQVLLDPITHAGCLHLKNLDRFARCKNLAFLLIALDIVLHGTLTQLQVKDELLKRHIRDFPKFRVTNAGYYNTLNSKLSHEFHVLEEVHETCIQGFCASKFFPVKKKTGRDRAIIDSRDAGDACRFPKPTNLPAVFTVITAGAKSKFFWTADLKHWFYQILINEKLRDLFIIRCGYHQFEKLYRMRVLPQGWSWSPHIAQCLAWGLILFSFENETPSKLYSLKLNYVGNNTDNPPESVDILVNDEVVASIFLWYDNIMVCGKDKHIVQHWKDRIIRNARELKAEFSEKMESVDVEAEFIGIHFFPNTVDKRNSYPTAWKHTDDKPKKVAQLLQESFDTGRKIAKAVGYLVWDSTLTQTPIIFLANIITIYNLQTAEIEKKSDWDRVFSQDMEKTDVDEIQGKLKTMMENRTQTLKRQLKKTKTSFCISDASGVNGEFKWGRWGYINLDPGFENLSYAQDVFGGDFNDEFQDPNTHINVKEIFAAVRCAQRFARPDTILFLGIDGLVALGILRKGLSLIPEVMTLLEEWQALLSAGCEIHLVYIYTSDNLADCVTRNEALDVSRYNETMKILSGRYVYTFPGGKASSETVLVEEALGETTKWFVKPHLQPHLSPKVEDVELVVCDEDEEVSVLYEAFSEDDRES